MISIHGEDNPTVEWLPRDPLVFAFTSSANDDAHSWRDTATTRRLQFARVKFIVCGSDLRNLYLDTAHHRKLRSIGP